ncbi:MAG: hypothetical protein A3B68_09170 [Candidatus Melainabacteria bacterium RIFCSPHIGHO2_02_FULL_34_12]|nr:MAG: hypothetical protein A3B68_09170 [Candidatus Melainabacteria bacterium RIFCSPHIGHO2_02_FULL_34_12]
MVNKDSIALLPLDDRPVSYLLPKQIADFSGVNLILPERKYLGDLNHGSDLKYIDNWCRGVLQYAPTFVVSLDSWVYGGLVQSRKHDFTLDELKKRVSALAGGEVPGSRLQNVYGFSSIMRIPNYNSSEEEKDYWKDYGESIFKWSELMHKVGRGITEKGTSHEELLEKWYESSKSIPVNVLADYKRHRDKNLTVNLLWIELSHDKCFECLIFSCDDSSRYGMNVIEAEYIKREIKKHRFSDLAKVISGTDEISLVLMTKANLKSQDKKPSLCLFFNSIEGKTQIPRYESNTIHESIKDQIDTLGLEIKDLNESDILVCIHLSDSVQGDHIFKIKPCDTSKNIEELKNMLEKINKPFILIDLAYANGSDPQLIEALINSKINWDHCYGYAGWNTCSNSTGSALAIGINRWIAEKNSSFNKIAFKKCLLTRFLDDYAYQAQIRHVGITEKEINKKIMPHVQAFSKLLGINDIKVKCSLPWKRTFEAEIDVI